jgi:hypothetical protein
MDSIIEEKFSFRFENLHTVKPEIVERVLIDVIKEFFQHLDIPLINGKKVKIYKSKKKGSSPQIIQGKYEDIIYLDIQKSDWCKCIYEFSHELCHHVINTSFFQEKNTFRWFEETICEVAAIYFLYEIANKWRRSSYTSWALYSSVICDYANAIKSKSKLRDVSSETFRDSFRLMSPVLFNEPCRRDYNRDIAVKLLPIFQKDPKTWRIIQHIHCIKTPQEKDLKLFIENWGNIVPASLRKYVANIDEVFHL